MLLGLLLTSADGAGADATCSVPPTNLTSALSEDGSAVVLTWEASPDCTPDEYAVYRRDMDVQGARMTKIDSVDGSVLTYTDSTVTAGQDYRYRIRSNDQGSRSNRTDITIPEATTPEPEATPEPASEPESESSEQASEPQQAERPVRQNFDNTPPSLLVVNVDGTSLVLIYNELLNESSTPATTDFTVDIGGTDYTPSSVVVRGVEVALTLSTGAASSDTVTLDYTIGSSPVQDDAATPNNAPAFTAQQVTNHTGASNDRPTFTAETATLRIDENSTSGTNVGAVIATDDDSGDTLTYSFPATFFIFTVGTNTGQFLTMAPLDFETTSSYVVPLYVRDSKSPSGDPDSIWDDSIKVTISVNDVNEPPTIGGTFDPEVDENTTTVGTYTVSDPDTANTHTWSIDSDTSVEENQDGSLFEIGSTSGVLSFKDAPDYETPGSLATPPANTYQVRLVATDSGSPALFDTFDVIVTVANVNEAPDITSTGSSHTSISKPEGTGPSDPLATYAADDPEDDTLTWTLGGPDAADFTINSSTGALRFQALTDYEDPRDQGTDNTYNVTVRVRDSKINAAGSTNGNTDTAVDDTINVVVTITNIDEAGTVTLPGTITAGQAVTATLTDHDGTTSSVTWQWSRSDTALGTYTPISGATSNPYTPVAADVGKYLKATASYTDPHGSGKSATSAASSQVASGNVDPSFSTTTATRSVPENSGGGVHVGAVVAATDDDGDTLEYWLSGADASSFTILATSGQILTRSGITYDFESSKKSYTVIVNVSDEKDDAGNADMVTDDTITVTINLSNVDEPGTVTITGTEAGGETLTASVTDIDGTITNLTWQWALAASASGPFAPISGATNNTYTSVAVDVNRYLRATASYTDPQGSGKSASAVTGQIAASNNEPTFGVDGVITREVAENSGANVDVGAAVAASDDDTGDTLHYWLTGSDASSFTINSSTGQIKTKSGVSYNFENREFYDVSVNVRDNKDAAGNSNTNTDDMVSVIVNVTDINETPAITTPQTAISVAENQTSVLTYVATDPDNSNNEADDADNTLTWSVETADDGSFFEIGATSGVLTFKNAPNFEDKQDAGGDGVYNVTVTVTDNGIDGARGASNHLSISKSLAVTVTDVNETPTLTTAPSTATFDENATGVVATYIATDPDATTGTMVWDLSGNDAGDFNITSTVNGTAELTFKNPPDYEMPDDTGTNNVYDVTVRVRDNGSPRLEDTQSVQVTVNDLNERPVVSGNATPDFAEVEFDHTATASELVIGTYTATDDDNADNAGLQTITFDLSGTDAAHFSIDSSTGVLSFSIEPDFENPADLADSNMMGASDNMYEVVVEADDGAGESNSVGTFTVTVRVTNVNETPEIPAGVPDESFAEIEWDAESADLDVMTYIPRDEETSTLTQLSWSLAGTDAADFEIMEDATTGHGTLSFRNGPNFEDPTDRVNATESHAADDNQYEVIVKIGDGVSTRDYPMTVTVTNVNETPEFTDVVGPGLHANEIEYDSGTTAADMASIPATLENQLYWYPFEARDEEGDDIIWTITGLDAIDFVIAEDPNVEEPNSDERAIVRWNIVPDRENPLGSHSSGSDFYVVTVNASDGTNVARYDLFIRIDDVNERPEFTGTPTATLNLDEHNATLDANLQEPPYAFPVIATYTGRDEEGGVTWSLTGTDAADFEIDSGGNVVFKEAPSFEDPDDANGDNVYNFTVVVRDVKSKTNRRTAEQPVTVTVRDVEEAGAISVSNLNPAVGESVTFMISDPDGGIVLDQLPGSGGFAWIIQTRTSGGAWQQLIHSNTAMDEYTYVADEDETDLEIRAIVSSYTDRRGGGKSAESEATAAITPDPIPNAPPRIRTGGTQNIPETSAGEEIGERVTATDRENHPLTFAIGEGADGALFEIHPTTGQLRTVQALDFETTTGLFLVPVNVSDGRDDQGTVETERVADDDTTVGIRVLDVEEEGVVTLSEPEPGVGVRVQATLTDGDGSITGRSWRWARSRDGRTGWTNIPNTTSTSTTSSYTTVLADAGFFLRAAVTYTDNRGGGKRAEGITALRVFGENQQPTFPASENGARSVPENSRSGTSIGDPVAAEDPERDRLTYSLSGTDAASFSIVASSGQLRVKEPLDFETKSSYEVTVDVHDGKDGLGNTSAEIDQSIDVTITVDNVDEAGAVTLTTLTATIQARVEVTAVLEDDDGPSSVTWAWARSPNGRTDWVNLVGATSNRYTPTLVDAGNFIRATASYSDGHGQNKTASKVSSRVGDPPPVNSAPAFPVTENGKREVPEDAQGGDAIGDPVAATDVNFDSLTYSLSGTDATSFEIDENSGQLRLASGVELDFEGKRSYRVIVSVSDGADQNDDADDVIDDTITITISVTNVNEAPVVSGDTTPSIAENSSAAVATYTGADPERDTLEWSVNSNDFWISSRGQLYFATPPNYEGGNTSFSIRVTAEDPGGLTGSLDVTVTVTDVEEAGVLTLSPLRGWQNTRFDAVLNDDDGSVSGEAWQWARSTNRSSWQDIAGARSSSYTAGADDVGNYLRATVEYSDQRGGNKSASAVTAAKIGDTKPSSNNAPAFDEAELPRSVGQGTSAGRSVGPPVKATDPDSDDILTYSLSGPDADKFEIDPETGQIRTKAVLDPDVQETHNVTVDVHDGFNPSYNPSDSTDDSVDVIITIARSSRGTFGGGGFAGGGGGGGGGGTGPTPSTVDFEWTVKHDIEPLASGHDSPTGMWSDGTTVWLLENGDGADDAIYAYDLATGERVEGREFELDERNRAPRGVWSDGTTIWVSDSGQNTLFAYDLQSGARLPERDLVLNRDNRNARGIWSDGEAMWVLNRNPSLFVYDLASGDFLARYSLDPRNSDPRGIWSDGVSFWVSDPSSSPRRLFAYRVPVLPDGDEPPEEPPALERFPDEDFAELSDASNNSPRGIWATGDIVYVADESDGRVYTYNMPDAIDARLASLRLSGVDIGVFDPDRTDYRGVIAEGARETTVEAGAVQRRTEVEVKPDDADGRRTNGHQVALDGLAAITIRVTSADGSRTKVYRVAFGAGPAELELGPAWTSFKWPGPGGVAIAEAGLPEAVVAVYTWDGTAGRWLGYFPDLDDIPGLNTLTTFSSGPTYWVTAEEAVTWTAGD
ncbi:MAG: cadherin domain-containing protein [Chloroflexi bacterium]|nr:cadherin domain-containing protein [Chloroflexota bacterium]